MANTLNLGNGNWATKEGSLLGYNSENNNYKPLPFDFSRASSSTVVNKDGLIEEVGSGEPRVDYKDNTKGALLLEPSRSNVYAQSNLFSFGGNVTSNNALSPDGTLNASKITKTSSSDQYVSLSWLASLSTSTIYSLSFFVKHNGDDVDLRYETNNFNDWGVSWNALFEVRENSVIASTVNNCTSNVINFGNGWYRVVVFVTTSSSITPTSPSNLIRVIGSDTKQFLMYGAMFEQGSYPTSYIPTQGSAVTRLADICLQGGFQNKNIFGSTQGSVVIEFKWDLFGYVFDFDDSSNTRIRIYNGGSDWKIRDYIGGSWINTGFSKSDNIKTKIGFKWDGTQFTTFQDGVKSSSTDSFASSMSINSITENKLNNTSNIQLYNTALTDQELQALTTI